MKILKPKQLKKPTMLQIIFGAVVSLFKKNRITDETPKQIGEYRLVSEMKEDADFKHLAVGIYDNTFNKRVFIKTWIGKVKDLNYYSLLNEYLVNDLLYKKISRTTFGDKIRTPKAIELIKNKNSLSLVFEFIDGKSLDKYPIGYQVETLAMLHNALLEISNTLTENDKKTLTKRTTGFYIFSLPFIAFLACVYNPRLTLKIIRSVFTSSFSLGDFHKSKLALAHRDFHADNILILGNNIYLTDCERMALTSHFYDETLLFLEFQKEGVSTELLNRYGVMIRNSFLKAYISLHCAISFHDDVVNMSYYLLGLNQ